MKTKNKILLLLTLVIIALIFSALLIYKSDHDNDSSSKLEPYELDENIKLNIPEFVKVTSQKDCNNPIYSEQTCYDLHSSKGYMRIIKEYCPSGCIYRETLGSLYAEDISKSKLISIENQNFYRLGYRTNVIDREDGGVVYGIVKVVPATSELTDKDSVIYTPFTIINEDAYSMMYVIPEGIESEDLDAVLEELDKIVQTIDFNSKY